jgi:aldose 1-epimerase
MALIHLAAGALRLVLAPESGGSVASFYSCERGHDVHWLRPATESALAARDPLGMASFPLVPWCNRLRGGRAHAHGRDIALAPNFNSEHTIHGLGWQRPWEVVSNDENSAELVFTFQGGQGWPWSLTAWQRFELDAHGFTCRMTVRNDDNATMPLGVGHHPYFPHTPGTRLACRLDQMWESSVDLLPTKLSRPAFMDELGRGITLSQLDLDNNFTGWNRSFLIEWPGRDRRLQLASEAPLDFFVLYCPPQEPVFCAEPVSNCTDWLNLVDQFARAQLGGTDLAPGELLRTAFRMSLVD